MPSAALAKRKGASAATSLGTVARAVAVMRALAEAQSDQSIKSLAAKLRLPASTVHRLLHLLMEAGIAEQTDRSSYRAGAEFYRLGSLIVGKTRITEIALPFMREVVEHCDEFCMLCLYLPAERAVMVVEIGELEPSAALFPRQVHAHTTGLGCDRALDPRLFVR